jgi:NADPH2:quinone reductase
MRQIQIHTYGAPSVLKFVEVEQPTPAAGEVLIKVAAAGVNFSDVLRRTNTYFIQFVCFGNGR